MTTTVPSRQPFQPASTGLSNLGSTSSNPIHIGASNVPPVDNSYKPPNTSSNGSMFPSISTSSLNVASSHPALASLSGGVSSTLSNLLSSPPTSTSTGFPPSTFSNALPPSTSIAPPNAALPLSTAQQTFPTRTAQTDPLSLPPAAAPPTISAAQAAAEAVLQAAELSSRLPPGAHPPTIAGGRERGSV